MELNIQMKQAGRRQNKITTAKLLLQHTPQTVGELICYTAEALWHTHTEKVRQSEQFENGDISSVILYEEEELADKAATGRIDFQFLKSSAPITKKQAVATAIEAFEDGIAVLFIDEKQYEKTDEPIALTGKEMITFVKLTMLSGRLW